MYGQKVYIESLDTNLEMIFTIALHKAPKCLQRMLPRLQIYDIAITYKKGREMYIADTLSRTYLIGNKANTNNDFEEYLNVRI